jgi:uncharacterized membrane protein YvlD (DUF360 family)
MEIRKRFFQLITIVFVQAVALLILTMLLPGLQIDSLGTGLLVAALFIVAQSAYWWLFIRFFAWLPVWLYPLLTFVLSGLVIMFVGSFVDGIQIATLATGIIISLALTAVNAVLGSLLALDLDAQFDKNVTQHLVKRRSDIIQSDEPGFVYLEIDGLGEKLFRRALAEGHLPTLKRWIDEGTHTVLGWETDFSAQTGAMQSGILLGNNNEVPAYRWWDRSQQRIVMSGDPRDTKVLEAERSNGRGILSDGGTSRGNMFSGDASESMLTFATLLDRSRASGPGVYLYLFSPYVVARIFTRFFLEVIKEWYQAMAQKIRKDKYIVSARTPFYAFFRAFMGTFLQDLITYTIISDIVRGVPAIYGLYAGYDDLGHFAGMQTPEAFEMLHETDRYFARVENALKFAPRPYYLVVLSDHGQSEGPTFRTEHGISLEELVNGLTSQDQEVFAALETNEAWDGINAFLSESINANTRTAGVLRTMLRSKTGDDGMVGVGPDLDPAKAEETKKKAKESEIIVMASGCTGLVNFRGSEERLTYEEIQTRYPELILGLVKHPGIGFVLVRSRENGDMVLSQNGIHFLDSNTVEGEDPLAVYGPNAPLHLKRESGFQHCPDLLVNSKYNPETEELAGFENQVSHHGGLGGPQNHAFILHPAALKANNAPIVGAMNVYKLLRHWRDEAQPA